MLDHPTRPTPGARAGAPTRGVTTAAVTAAALLTGFAALQLARLLIGAATDAPPQPAACL